jgi:hypothetical protein
VARRGGARPAPALVQPRLRDPLRARGGGRSAQTDFETSLNGVLREFEIGA